MNIDFFNKLTRLPEKYGDVSGLAVLIRRRFLEKSGCNIKYPPDRVCVVKLSDSFDTSKEKEMRVIECMHTRWNARLHGGSRQCVHVKWIAFSFIDVLRQWTGRGRMKYLCVSIKFTRDTRYFFIFNRNSWMQCFDQFYDFMKKRRECMGKNNFSILSILFF